METSQHLRALRAPSVLLTVIFACGFTAFAQSGRRSTVKPTTPAPPVSEPRENETKPSTSPKLQLIVGMEDPSPFRQMPYYLSDVVLRACVGRLSEGKDVLATATPRNINRGEAAKMARQEKERFVVWLQLGSDRADVGRQTITGAEDLYVNYLILEPVTAKIKKVGRTYFGQHKVGNVGVSGPTSTTRQAVYSEHAARESAREAAERILAAFGVKISSERGPR